MRTSVVTSLAATFCATPWLRSTLSPAVTYNPIAPRPKLLTLDDWPLIPTIGVNTPMRPLIPAGVSDSPKPAVHSTSILHDRTLPVPTQPIQSLQRTTSRTGLTSLHTHSQCQATSFCYHRTGHLRRVLLQYRCSCGKEDTPIPSTNITIPKTPFLRLFMPDTGNRPPPLHHRLPTAGTQFRGRGIPRST